MANPNWALGIDVSRWKGQVNWQAVRAAGGVYGIPKASDGETYADPTFITNWRDMKTYGVIRGGFHYFQPGADPVKQAQNLARVMQLEPGDLPPVLDVEERKDVGPDIVQRVKTCLDTLESIYRVKPIIYTGLNYWQSVMGDPAWSSAYPLWIANYVDGEPPAKDQPSIPRSWTTWAFWQYTEHGNISGVNGDVDKNLFNGTLDDLIAWVGAAPSASVAATPAAAVNVPPPIVPAATIPNVTNQMMINAFAKVFGADVYWGKVQGAGIASIAKDRKAPYSGPAINDLPNLTAQEKSTIVSVLNNPS